MSAVEQPRLHGLVLERACGAADDEVINTSRETLPEALEKRGVIGGPALIYDAACHTSILEEAFRIGVLGSSTTPSAIPQQELTKKELTLYASRLNCAMFPTVIDWITRGLVDPGHIITHQVDFRDVSGAFDITESALRLQSATRLRRGFR